MAGSPPALSLSEAELPGVAACESSRGWTCPCPVLAVCSAGSHGGHTALRAAAPAARRDTGVFSRRGCKYCGSEAPPPGAPSPGLEGWGSRGRLFSSPSLGGPSVLVAHRVPSSCLFAGSPGQQAAGSGVCGRLTRWSSLALGPLAWKVRECPTECLPEVDLVRVTAVSMLGHPWAQASRGRSPA